MYVGRAFVPAVSKRLYFTYLSRCSVLFRSANNEYVSMIYRHQRRSLLVNVRSGTPAPVPNLILSAQVMHALIFSSTPNVQVSVCIPAPARKWPHTGTWTKWRSCYMSERTFT